MSNVSITVKITRNDMKNFGKKSEKIQQVASKALKKGAEMLQRRAVFEAPKGVTGELARGIKIEPRGKFNYAVVSTVPYSAERELGDGLPDLRRVKGVPRFEDWWSLIVGTKIPYLATVSRVTPFMGPALRHTEKRIFDLVRRKVIHEMEVT